MKKTTVEIKIIFLIAFAMIAVFAAGYLAYNSINFILHTIKNESQPNLSLLVLKEIKGSLLIGESNIEYYTLTNDKKYLKPYQDAIKDVDGKIATLYEYDHGDKTRIAQIDTINVLIEQKFRLWEKMISKDKNNRVVDALDKLSDAIDKTSDTVTLQIPKSIMVEINDSTPQNKIKIKEHPKKRESILNRIFKKKSYDQSVNELDEPKDTAIEKVVEAIDTSIALGLNKNHLQKEITRLKTQEGEKTRRLTAYEVSIRQQNNRITQRLEKLISKIEKEELFEIRRKASEADKMVEETNKWAMTFLLLFINLLIGVIFIILRYVRKSHASQVALTRARNAALKLSQTKEQFLANMSHEIRTPMSAIVGFTEQVLQMPLDDKPKEYIEIVKKSADHLLQIINAILDFSKLESGKLKLEEHSFNINELLNQAYQLYKPSADLRNTMIYIEPADNSLEILHGDSFRLRQILFNLISNAVKFTNLGTIYITARTHKEVDNKVTLTLEVKDTGIGIPEDQAESIFEEFTQAESSTSRNYGGTGLGLSIVKKLVLLHGGSVSAKNTPQGGACFTVKITYGIGTENDLLEMETTNNATTTLPEGLKFLIADDDDYNCKLIELIFCKWQLPFKIVQSGKETIDALNNENFDLLLLDIHMPQMNGIEVAQHIRSKLSEPAKNMPIIAVTATISKDEIKKCNQVGVNDFLAKPFTEQLLLQKITDVIAPSKPLSENDIKTAPLKNSDEGQTKPKKTEFKDLYIMAGGSKSFVKDMLIIFLKTTGKGLGDLKKSHSEKDWWNLAEYAHKIKAPCKHLDATPLSNLLKNLELTARKGSDEKLIDALYFESLDGIEQLILKVTEHLNEHFPAYKLPTE